MNKHTAVLYLSLLLFASFWWLKPETYGQKAPSKFWIQFTDKASTPYTIGTPQAFLSKRAIDRRERQHIPIVENDLPVDPVYVNAVRTLGAAILHQSRWFNAVTVYLSDTSILSQIQMLPFVKQVSYVGQKKGASGGIFPGLIDKWEVFHRLNPGMDSAVQPARPLNTGKSGGFDYGPSLNQVSMIRGDVLHSLGFRGEGKVIAVLDAGFYHVNELAAFDSLWSQGRILGSRDFVNPGGNVFDEDTHGMMVLSVMGSNLPGEIIGTAPHASYWLLRSEDAGSEYPVEENNWVAAAEFADSVGADIINSSLGYTVFYDTLLNHAYSDMDGNTTHVTIGADLAASKGILVVNSAGNSGYSPWYYIGAPADGDSVMAVGAVDDQGRFAPFSSAGPSYDGRIKPNVAAQGQGTYLYSSAGFVFPGNGTSFACPLIAGAAACLWQSHPGAGNMEIFSAIQESADQFDHPDYQKGYGIPDFEKADMLLYHLPDDQKENLVITIPNPAKSWPIIQIFSKEYQPVSYLVTEASGRTVIPETFVSLRPGDNLISLEVMGSFPSGLYLILLKSTDQVRIYKILII